MSTFSVLIIEDEPQAADRLARLIASLRPGAQVLATLDSVTQSVGWLRQHPAPDLLLMDIQLADGLSFAIFDQVRVTSPVIFTTAYDEYALRAFKVNSIDYLLKPVDEAELRAALDKLSALRSAVVAPDKMMQSIADAMRMLSKKYKERFVIRVGEHLRSIEIAEIRFFFSQEKATFAQTADHRKHVLDFTLDQLEDLVDPARFFRINRKYLVSVEAIRDMVSHTNSRLKLLLHGSEDPEVIVARERVQEFREWLDR
ncbi:MAG: response regulator transcription factor [Cyclobacteriaceae bacterium]|nr:response regulator transcription factor [Cyclobacteriaceae bacterium]